MTSFSFPDLFAMYYVPNWVAQGQFNVYKLVKEYKAICPWLSATWPPLYYYTIGVYLWLIKSIGLLKSNLFTLNVCPVWNLILNRSFLFWAKMPLLLFHALSALIFSKFFNKKQALWFLFWFLNPVALFVSLIEGQFEIIPAFFLLFSLYYAKNKKPFLAALSLGIGGAFKHIPFLLVVPFAILLTHNWKQRLKFVTVTILPYILALAPILSPELLRSLSFSENTKMLSAGINIGNEIHISFYIVAYILLTLKLLYNNSNRKGREWSLLLTYTFLYLAIYFLFTFWFVQRLLILIPSLLLLASKNKKIFKSLNLLYIAYFAYVLFLFPGLFDQTLLRPIFSNINTSITPFETISSLPFLYSKLLQKITISTITAIFLWLTYLIARQSKEEKIIIKKKHILYPVSILIGYIVIVFFYAGVFQI